MKLTEPQKRALRCLAGKKRCTPSEIGYAMRSHTVDGRRMDARGAGWMGGSMGKRLVKKGLAQYSYYEWGLAYRITEAGLAALKEADAA